MHTIHNLKKFTEYTVHVKAYNSKGISPPSEDTTVFTLEDGENILRINWVGWVAGWIVGALLNRILQDF